MNKLSRGDGIPVELFQILKDNAVKVLPSICQHILKTQQSCRTGKCQFSFQSPKKGNAKEYSNYLTVSLISHTSKVMLKILQARLQQYELRNSRCSRCSHWIGKGRGIRDLITNICWIIEKATEFQQNI